MSLTAEQKNATMNEERAFLTKLFESALQNRFADLKRHVEKYQQQEQQKKHSSSSFLTCVEILSQFRDAKRRTALHFACQSSATPQPQSSSSKTNTNDNDIVEDMMAWLAAQEGEKIKQQQQPAPKGDGGDGSTTTTTLDDLIRLKDKDGLTPLMLAAQQKEPPQQTTSSTSTSTSDTNNNNNNDNKANSSSNPSIAERRVLALLRQATASLGGGKLGLARSRAGATALHYAAGAGANRATIQALYQSGTIALSTFSKQGGTPLHWAVAVPPPANYQETIAALLDCGANIHQSQQAEADSSQQSRMIPPPLHMATAAGNMTHAQFLVQEMMQRQPADLQPSLEFFLQPGNISIFHMLADLNGVTVLNQLIQQLTPQQFQTLVQQHQNDEGLTALQVAAREHHVGPVLILLGEGHSEEDAHQYIQQFHKGQQQQSQSKPPQQEQQSTTTTTTKQDANNDNDESVKARLKQLEQDAQDRAKALLQESNAKPISQGDQEQSLKCKQEGNQLFAQQKWSLALDQYTAAIYLDPTNATFYSNRSACSFKLQDYESALMDGIMAQTLITSSSSTTTTKTWSKPSYRIAVARLALHQYEDAALAAFDGLKLDPDNDELKQLVQQCVKQGRTEFLSSKQQEQKKTNQNEPFDESKDLVEPNHPPPRPAAAS